MIDHIFEKRLRYLPSGKFDVGRFFVGLIFLVLASCISGVIAGCLYCAIATVPVLTYLTVVVTIAIGVPLAWFVAKFIRFSHCRNPSLAGLAGTLCGVVTFLSACQISGAAISLRDGKQTTFLAAVARTDQIRREISDRVFGHSPQKKQREFNFPKSLLLILEIGTLIGMPLKSGRYFAGRAYGEMIDRWLDRSIIRANPGSGDKIISVLQAGDYLVHTLSNLSLCSTDSRPTVPTYLSRLSHRKSVDVAATWMVLEVSPFPAANGAYEAFLSATEVDSNGKKRPLFFQLKLRSHEIAAARKLFLDPLVERSPKEARTLNDDTQVVTAGPHVRLTANASASRGI
jgi:hypothetical protein